MLIRPFIHIEVGDRRKRGICKKINIKSYSTDTLPSIGSILKKISEFSLKLNFLHPLLELILIQISMFNYEHFTNNTNTFASRICIL